MTDVTQLVYLALKTSHPNKFSGTELLLVKSTNCIWMQNHSPGGVEWARRRLLLISCNGQVSDLLCFIAPVRLKDAVCF